MNPWYKIQLAQILYAKGYYQAAVKELELILSQHKYHWAAQTFLIDMHQKMSFLADANELIRERILEPLQRAATLHSPECLNLMNYLSSPSAQIHKDWYNCSIEILNCLVYPTQWKLLLAKCSIYFPMSKE